MLSLSLGMGPFISYVTLFLAIFRPPPPVTLSPDPLRRMVNMVNIIQRNIVYKDSLRQLTLLSILAGI